MFIATSDPIYVNNSKTYMENNLAHTIRSLNLEAVSFSDLTDQINNNQLGVMSSATLNWPSFIKLFPIANENGKLMSRNTYVDISVLREPESKKLIVLGNRRTSQEPEYLESGDQDVAFYYYGPFTESIYKIFNYPNITFSDQAFVVNTTCYQERNQSPELITPYLDICKTKYEGLNSVTLNDRLVLDRILDGDVIIF